MSRRRIALRLARLFVAATWGGLSAGLTLLIVGPGLFGHQSFTVMSGSMEPAVHVGDVVVDARIRPAEATVGDIVTFRDPEDATRLLTHRVRKLSIDGDLVRFETKGDANNSIEQWSVPAAGTIGVVRYRVPKVGYVLALTRTPHGRILSVAAPAMLLGVWALVRIWRPKREVVVDAAAA